MTNESITPQGKDPQLWHLAQKRASFKKHLVTYLIINAFLWLLWFFGGADTYGSGLPWPVWPTFGWGIGLVFHYMSAYVTTGSDSVEREYQKLKNNQNL